MKSPLGKTVLIEKHSTNNVSHDDAASHDSPKDHLLNGWSTHAIENGCARNEHSLPASDQLHELGNRLSIDPFQTLYLAQHPQVRFRIIQRY